MSRPAAGWVDAGSAMAGRRRWTVRFAVTLCGVCLVAAGGAARADPTAADPNGPSPDPDVAAGRKAIAARDWRAAIKALSAAALRDTRNADIQNDLGYAHRNAGELAQAFEHYDRALNLDPRHRGAHEYAGEAALIAGDLARAERHLMALKSICLLPCEEYDDLKSAIDAYRSKRLR